MGPRELPADFHDLLGGLALSEDDFREPDAPDAVEIERVIGAAHFASGSYPLAVSREGET